MGVPTYQPIANITLGSATASVTFSGITQQYRDLVLVTNALITGATDMGLKFNGDITSTNYFFVYMAGFGSSTGSGAGNTNLAGYAHSDGMLNVIQILDYSATDKHKSALIRYGNAGNFAATKAYRWANNAAVTSLLVDVSGTTFSPGATFTLYGVLA